MDKLQKAIVKLTRSERIIACGLIQKLVSGDLRSLDVKKLKGYTDTYRLRKGKIRIIFRKGAERFIVIAIARRNETTYRK